MFLLLNTVEFIVDIEQVISECESLLRHLRACATIQPLYQQEIRLKQASNTGMEHLLPKQAIPITFLGITVGHREVLVGNRRDATEKIAGQVSSENTFTSFVESAEQILQDCRRVRDAAQECDEVRLEECMTRLREMREAANNSIDRQRELINSHCSGWRRR